jgi:hypothetical protein
MARGFESKDVEFQQAEADRLRNSSGRTRDPREREAQGRRRTVELALLRARGDLATARAAPHRRMLEEAIGALEAQLASLAAEPPAKGTRS